MNQMEKLILGSDLHVSISHCRPSVHTAVNLNSQRSPKYGFRYLRKQEAQGGGAGGRREGFLFLWRKVDRSSEPWLEAVLPACHILVVDSKASRNTGQKLCEDRVEFILAH